MTSVSNTTYASGAEVEVSKKKLNAGEYIQLTVNYEQMANKFVTDSIVVTLSPEEAVELSDQIIKKVKGEI